MEKSKRIVLVHGWGARADRLEPLANTLEKIGWEVLNLDLPGFGAVEPESAWGLAEYAQWVERQKQDKWGNERYVFFGHSFGGRVAIKTALIGGKDLTGAVLCSPGGWTRPGELKRKGFALAAKAGKAVMGDLGWGKKLLYKLAREHDYERASQVMKEVFKKTVDEDVKVILTKIEVPILVLWGDKDRMVNVDDAKEVVKNLQQGEINIYSGEGHRLPYNQPGWVAERIDTWFGKLR